MYRKLVFLCMFISGCAHAQFYPVPVYPHDPLDPPCYQDPESPDCYGPYTAPYPSIYPGYINPIYPSGTPVFFPEPHYRPIDPDHDGDNDRPAIGHPDRDDRH